MESRDNMQWGVSAFLRNHGAWFWTGVAAFFSLISGIPLQIYAGFEGINFILIQQNLFIILMVSGVFVGITSLIIAIIILMPLFFRDKYFSKIYNKIVYVFDWDYGLKHNHILKIYICINGPSVISFIVCTLLLVISYDVYSDDRAWSYFPALLLCTLYISSLLFYRMFYMVSAPRIKFEFFRIIMINILNFIILFGYLVPIIFYTQRNIGISIGYVVEFIAILLIVLVNLAVCMARDNFIKSTLLISLILMLYSPSLIGANILGGIMLQELGIGGRIPIDVYLKNSKEGKIFYSYCLLIDRGSSITVANITDEKPCVLKNDIRYDENITIPMSEIQSIVRKVKPKDEIVKEGA